MTWGSGEWGSSPWGGSDPSTGGVVSVDSVLFITPTLIRLNLSTGVIVNTSYKANTNYTVAIHGNTPIGADAVSIVNVLPPSDGSLAVDYIYLETTPHTLGAFYTVTFTALSTLDGVAGGASTVTAYSSRITKTMMALKSLPSHFDRRVDALIFNIIAAITTQDDTAGGSRNDEFS